MCNYTATSHTCGHLTYSETPPVLCAAYRARKQAWLASRATDIKTRPRRCEPNKENTKTTPSPEKCIPCRGREKAREMAKREEKERKAKKGGFWNKLV